jgi:uncharacterized phage-associated protein
MMAVSPNAAAQHICERSGWTVTQLSLQKILYLAHMVHLGRGHGPLVQGNFEAWDYGPVHPILYHKVKSFGAKPIPNVFWSQEVVDGTTREILEEACDNLLHLTPGALVQNTHWKDGAWAMNYSPSAKNILIPERDIIAEYQKRVAGKQAA